MKSFENSTKKLIIEKIRDLIIFEKDMSPLLKENDISKERSEYRLVISCSYKKSELILKNIPLEKKNLVSKRENALSSSLEERG